MQDFPKVKTSAKIIYCEYAGRKVPVFYTYSNGALLKIECPKNGCKRTPYCEAFRSPPPPQISDE